MFVAKTCKKYPSIGWVEPKTYDNYNKYIASKKEAIYMVPLASSSRCCSNL